MQKYYAHTDFISTDAKDFELYVEVYLANHVDCLPLAEVMDTQAQEIQALRLAMDPRRWTQQHHEAWHRALPNTQAAFDALLAIVNTSE